jgi:hypothetical protein
LIADPKNFNPRRRPGQEIEETMTTKQITVKEFIDLVASGNTEFDRLEEIACQLQQSMPTIPAELMRHSNVATTTLRAVINAAPAMPAHALDASELATVLAALRFFQKEFEGCGAKDIYEAFPDHFEPVDGVQPMPLGTDDIDDLCERLNLPPAAPRPPLSGALGDFVRMAAAGNTEADDLQCLACDLLGLPHPQRPSIIPHDPQDDEPEDGAPEGAPRLRNHYRCAHEDRPAQNYPPAEWTEDWSCACNDRCPVCNAEIEPYQSDDLAAQDEQPTGPIACSHPGCTKLVNTSAPYFATPCGTYCGQHMRLHVQECEICRDEFPELSD